MTAKKSKAPVTPPDKPNREQRRRQKFGYAGGATTEPWPQSDANPVFASGGAGEPTGENTARSGDPNDGVTLQADVANGGQTEGTDLSVARDNQVGRERKG
jgi:hypothetical protein